MEEDEIIEQIFNIIMRNGFVDLSPFDIPELSIAAIGLKGKGYLITPHINTNLYELSKTGEEVLQAGGWKLYTLMKAKEKKILDDKQFYELKISKFKYYTLWPAMILGIVGGIYSIVEMAKSYTENKKSKIESINETQKSHILLESQKNIDTVSVQTKTK